jgi:hypothetical protein
MPRLPKPLGFCLGLLGVLIAAEAALQLLPVSTATMRGYHHDADVLTYPSHHRWQTATGWDLRNAERLQSNNWGFAAARDFLPDPRAIALIGDSYVEASMLPVSDRPAAQLERLLHARPVYALGSPGTALLDYAQRIRIASEQFRIRDVVILLERFDARQSLCGSGNIHAHCLDPTTLARRIERQPPPGLIKRLARHSALAQYFGGQIKVQPRAIWKAIFSRGSPEQALHSRAIGTSKPEVTPSQIAQMTRMVDAVVSAFFSDAAPFLKGKLVVVVDGRRTGPAQEPDLADLERRHLMDRLREHGAIVRDLEPAFEAYARESSRRLEVGPYDDHLNRLGVEIAMGQAASAMSD